MEDKAYAFLANGFLVGNSKFTKYGNLDVIQLSFLISFNFYPKNDTAKEAYSFIIELLMKKKEEVF